MRPDVAAFGALMFPTVLLVRHCVRRGLLSAMLIALVSADFQSQTQVPRSCPVPVSSQGTTRMSRSRPRIIAAVGPPHEAGVIGVDLGGLAPVGAVRGNPSRQLRPRDRLHA